MCVRRGFTLVEAMVAISIAAMAGAVLLLAIETTVQNTTDSVEQTIAVGMARQLIDEVLGARYVAVGASPYELPLGASDWEAGGAGRERFNDTDDYNAFSAQPPTGRWGVPLGSDDGAGNLRHPNFRTPTGRFDDWRQTIEVYYVDENDFTQRLTGGDTSNLRAVEVTISRQQQDGSYRELARLRRVLSYVPHPN